tara:strand:- start:18381 stop:18575 length:195 start_codon:yes stop_codon:yes gene_type:complete
MNKYSIKLANSKTGEVKFFITNHVSFSEAVVFANRKRNFEGINLWKIVTITEVFNLIHSEQHTY